MENSQVKFRFIPIIRAFSKEEFKEFGRFVKSPYYNSNKKIIALYETLKKYYPELNHSHLTGEKLYKKIYPGKKFKKSEIEKLSYAMRVLAEKFLTVKGLSKEKPISALGLLRELNDRNLSSNFKRKWKETKSILNDGNCFIENLVPSAYLLESEYNKFCHKSENEDLVINNAQQIADGLVSYFLIRILKVYSYMLNESKNAYDFNYKMDFLEPVINYIESNPSFATPLVKMLYYCIKLLENDKDEYFENLKEIVYKNFEIIDKNDRYDMFIVLISHCNKKINEGNIRFVRELFNIYIKFLKNDALMPNGFMHHLTYKIIVNCALSLQELKWAENFIETYKPYLKDKHRNSTYYFSKARLYFVKCEYEKAIDCFGKVGMVDISYKYDTKWQMARTYYELGEIDSFLPLIDSYKHLLAKNKKISSKSRKTQLRQIGYLIKLFKLRNNFNGAALNKLKAEFLNNEYIIGRSWFLKKTDEIFLSRASAKAV